MQSYLYYRSLLFTHESSIQMAFSDVYGYTPMPEYEFDAMIIGIIEKIISKNHDTINGTLSIPQKMQAIKFK